LGEELDHEAGDNVGTTAAACGNAAGETIFYCGVSHEFHGACPELVEGLPEPVEGLPELSKACLSLSKGPGFNDTFFTNGLQAGSVNA